MSGPGADAPPGDAARPPPPAAGDDAGHDEGAARDTAGPPAAPDAAAEHARLKALFDELVEQDAATVEARLAAEPPERAARLRALLGHSAALEGHTTQFSAPVAHVLKGAQAPELSVGHRLGAWTLVEVIGRGGMGQVFRAERSDGLYQQQAAVKLLRGLASPLALSMLAAERQILARLVHPNIARLLDGGTTPRGRPYLVMEFVEGQPIDRWVAAQRPSMAALTALLDQVFDAVAHAHRQLIVHCDLKPANVLVDRDGRAILLDFGIAQLAGEAGADGPAVTALTPAYASPEQHAGQPATPASDVFSLGRMTGELLQAADAPRAGEWRAIVERATAADPSARYADVPALKADFDRLRRHLPVRARMARGGAWAYRLQCLARRRWPWLLTAAAAATLSALFVLRLVHERDRALEAEARAAEEAAATQQVSDFLVDLFEGADPNLGGRADTRAVELLDRGRERLDAGLEGREALKARLQHVLGRVYENVGQPQTAIDLYRQALAAPQADASPLVRAQRLQRLAMAHTELWQSREALAAAEEALSLFAATVPADDPQLASARDTLGFALSLDGQHDRAVQVLLQALQVREARAAAEPLPLAGTLHNLAIARVQAQQPELAVPAYRRALALKDAQLAPTHPSRLASLQGLVVALARLQRQDEALPLAEEVVRQRRALHGERSGRVAAAVNELGNLLHDSGRFDAAEAAYREALAIDTAVSGPAAPITAVRLNNLATLLEDRGDPAAEDAFRRSAAIRDAALPEGDRARERGRFNLARWLVRHGRAGEGVPMLEAQQADRLARSGPAALDSPEMVELRLVRAEGLLALSMPAEAARELQALEPLLPQLRPERAAAWLRLQARWHAAVGEPAPALARLEQATARLDGRLAAGHPLWLGLRLEQAALLQQAGRSAEACRLQAAAAPALAAQHPASRWRRLAATLAACP